MQSGWMIVRGWCLAERHRKGVGESHLVRLASVLMTVGGLITACQSAPPVLPVAPPPPAVPTASRPIPSSTDSRASYHFMLGYQAELEQNTEQAIKEYQLALQTDPASHYIKARLACATA